MLKLFRMWILGASKESGMHELANADLIGHMLSTEHVDKDEACEEPHRE